MWSLPGIPQDTTPTSRSTSSIDPASAAFSLLDGLPGARTALIEEQQKKMNGVQVPASTNRSHSSQVIDLHPRADPVTHEPQTHAATPSPFLPTSSVQPSQVMQSTPYATPMSQEMKQQNYPRSPYSAYPTPPIITDIPVNEYERSVLYNNVIEYIQQLRRSGHDVVCISDIDNTVLIPAELTPTQQVYIIPQVVHLHTLLHQIQCPIYFVTARDHGSSSENHEWTVKDLKSYGFDFKRLFSRVSPLYTADGQDAFTSSALFKKHVRDFFAACGKTVAINIGDLDGDFYQGGFSWGLRVPPEFYTIPE